MKKRISYFDLAKGIGIILVVLGHMENISGELRTWISSFHMPLFFIVSGMLLAAKGDITKSSEPVSLVIKTAKGLLIPYLWFSLIYIPIDIMNLFIHNVDGHTFVQNILDSVTFSGVSVMWFLPALFIAETTTIIIVIKTSEIIKKSLKNNDKYNEIVALGAVLLVGFAVSILSYGIWSNIRILYEANSNSYVYATLLGFIRVILRGLCMSIHVIFGYLTFGLIEKIKVNGYCIALGVILFALNMGFCLKNGAVDNHFLLLNNLFLYYLCAFVGSMAIILICKGIGSIGFIEFFGKNSLIIMATHLQCYLLYAGILIAIAIDAHVTRAKSYVYMFNSVVFTMLFEVIVILVINKFFPFIVGKGSIKDLFIAKKDIQ